MQGLFQVFSQRCPHGYSYKAILPVIYYKILPSGHAGILVMPKKLPVISPHTILIVFASSGKIGLNHTIGKMTITLRYSRSLQVRGKKQDLPGIALPVSQAPAMIFLPPCDPSHIPPGLDPVAPPAEDLEIVQGPLVASHGDWPDVVEDVGMMVTRTFHGIALMNLPLTPGTFPSLLIADKPPHAGDRGSLFEPVLQRAGSLAADGMLVSRVEVQSLTTAMGTGTAGDPLLLFRAIPAIFAHYHDQASPSRSVSPDIVHIFVPVQNNTGEDGVKVFRHKST